MTDEALEELLFEPTQSNRGLDHYLALAFPQGLEHRGIHRRDEMFAHALSQQNFSFNDALTAYHHSGLMAWHVLEQVLAMLPAQAKWFDLGCGYGRVLRFARVAHPARTIVGCEIDASAVRAVGGSLGVETVRSSYRPERLEVDPESFGLVSALSVFTHLPEPSFREWLRAAWNLVEPGGLLALSATDLSELPEDLSAGSRSFVFERQSESDDLDQELYGTAWISDSYLRSLIDEECEGVAWVETLRRGLWNSQDLWILAKDSEGGAAEWRGVERPPFGYLDGVEITGSRTVRIAGWALREARSLSGSREPTPRVHVRLQRERGGEFESVAEQLSGLQPRSDLAAAHGADWEGGSWNLELRSEVPFDGTEYLSLSMDDWVFHSSLLDGADRSIRALRERLENEQRRRVLERELERRGGLPLRFARALGRRLAALVR